MELGHEVIRVSYSLPALKQITEDVFCLQGRLLLMGKTYIYIPIFFDLSHDWIILMGVLHSVGKSAVSMGHSMGILLSSNIPSINVNPEHPRVVLSQGSLYSLIILVNTDTLLCFGRLQDKAIPIVVRSVEN